MNQQIITSDRCNFNAFFSHPSVGSQLTTSSNLVQYSPRQYKALQHKIINEVIKLKNYRGNGRTLLHEVAKRCDGNLESRASQACLAKSINADIRTIKRWLKRYKADGLISYEEVNTWGPGVTNKITLLFIQHKLPLTGDKMSYNINNLNTKPLDPDLTYYGEYVSLLAKQEKGEPEPPPRQAKMACPVKLASNEADAEVKRVATAWSLTAEQTEYAARRMRAPGITNPAKFLATMAKQLSLGVWNDQDLKPEPVGTKARWENQQRESELEVKAHEQAERRCLELGYDPSLQMQWYEAFTSCKFAILNKLRNELGLTRAH